MKAMLLAAGRGERLRPLTDTVPKSMLCLEGKPLLEHWLEKLRAAGIHDVIINLHHLGHAVTEYFGSGAQWDMHIEYSEEKELLGTAGAVRRVRQQLSGERFIVAYADSQSTCGVADIVRFHAQRGAVATMSVCYIDDPRSSGIVGFDQQGRIERFLEKPTADQVFSHFINAGLYVFEPNIFEYIPHAGTPDFSRDVFPEMLRRNVPLYGFDFGGYVLRFDTPEDWKTSLAFLANRKATDPTTTRFDADSAMVHESLGKSNQ